MVDDSHPKGWSEEVAREWIQGDGLQDLLRLPRLIAAVLVGCGCVRDARVLDIGAGPGAFLETFLDELPYADGVWLDLSQAMREEAGARLARFGERVTYTFGDMSNLSAVGLQRGFDAVITSRASHHLDRADLGCFYSDAGRLARGGGWMVNLDHVGLEDPWEARLRAVRDQLTASARTEPTHSHDAPLLKLSDHVDAMKAGGLTEIDTPWRAFNTVLMIGRVDQEDRH